MAQNERISLSLANKIDILNKSQSIDARYGVYDTEQDALDAMNLYGLDGRQVAVYTDKPNGKVQIFVYNKVLEQLEPIATGGGGDGLQLGETSTTAYRGDRGKDAYDHSELTTGNPHNVDASDVGLGNVDNTRDIDKPISNPTQLALDDKEDKVNKATDFSVVNHTLYPTVKAVDDRFGLIDLTIENDITSAVEAGAIEPGDVVLEGTSLTDFVKQLLLKTFYPSFTNSSFTASAPAREVGTATNTITASYSKALIKGAIVGGIWSPSATQGDRTGDLNKVWIDGVDNGTSLTATVTQMTTLGTNTVPLKVDYDAGIQPTDSTGADYQTPLPAGSLTTNANWNGFYYRTVIAGTDAPTATDIRNDYSERRSSGGVINLASGTTATRFDVFVPQGSVITSAIDVDNMNLDITSDFVLQEGSDFSGLDANEDVVMYKHYIKVIDNPYPASTTLEITVT